MENEETCGEVTEVEAQETEPMEGEQAVESTLVLGDDDPRDPGLRERALSEEIAWKGKIFDVSTLEVELPSGRRSRRDIVRHPGAAAVVALTESARSRSFASTAPRLTA